MGSTMDPAARGVHSALHTDPGLGMWVMISVLT